MVEVFKTNVSNDEEAKLLLDQLHACYPQYKANFDLDDCDKVLRVEAVNSFVETSFIINLLHSFNFYVETMSDNNQGQDSKHDIFTPVSMVEA